MGNASEWIRGLAQDPMRDTDGAGFEAREGFLEVPSIEALHGSESASLGGTERPNTLEEAKNQTQVLEILNRLMGRLGGVPAGFSLEELGFLEQTLQRLDQSGPETLGPAECSFLYACPQTASIAQENGIPFPTHQQRINSGELLSVEATCSRLGGALFAVAGAAALAAAGIPTIAGLAAMAIPGKLEAKRSDAVDGTDPKPAYQAPALN